MSRTETFASIKTRYHGPTNFNGSRISVTDDGGIGMKRRRIIVEYDHELDVTDNHCRAAKRWIDKFINPTSMTMTDVYWKPGAARIASPGFAFDGDYYWTWDFGQEGGAK